MGAPEAWEPLPTYLLDPLSLSHEESELWTPQGGWEGGCPETAISEHPPLPAGLSPRMPLLRPHPVAATMEHCWAHLRSPYKCSCGGCLEHLDM